jgi:peptidoglycan/LPS O-acetylase OafA/YrhL
VVQLDFVRGIAILLVIDFHAIFLPTGNIIARANHFVGTRIGWMGVDLFFVLSGFLVGGLLVQELTRTGNIQVQRFLVRRMMKIWPAYYFYIVFQIVVRRHPLDSFLWQNLLNIQNYVGTSLKHTWSLAVEEHFYLALPVVLLLIYKRRALRVRIRPVLIAICAAVLCVRIVTFPISGAVRVQWETHTRLDSLLFGVLLSHLLYASRDRFDRLLQYRVVLGALGIAVFAIALLQGGAGTAYMSTLGYTVNYLGFGALTLLIYGYHGALIRSRVYKAIAWIGTYSYGIYLWHLSVREPLASLARRFPDSIAWLFLIVAQYSAAIVLGFIVTKLVEFPVLRLRDRFFPRGVAELPPANP